MKAILLLLSLLFSFLTPLKALDQINERLLEHAQQYHDSTGNLADLVDYLISAADNQRQQAEVIYYWISQNISYDIESLLDGSYLTDTADVWRSRKGVCEDYATLYKRMAELAGLECYVVRGYAVGYDYNGASPFEGINHSWNVVLVSGKFRFIDSCWGSGGIYSDGDEPQFVPLMQLQYVMIPVAASLPSHLPGDPMWQFRNRPYSIKDFVTGISPSQSE
ncbi:MAG: transglutaminase domain-containing protein, partial [Bacteroidota bacterium]